MSRIKTLVCLAVVSTLQVVPGIASAQAPAESSRGGSLLDAVRKAVVSNPDVQTAWHGYKAATAEQDAVLGGFLPEVDLNASAGHRWRKDPSEMKADGSKKDDWNYSGAALELNQMIYDGFATSSEFRQMGYQRLVRYYELLDASENVGLEVTRAHGDVERQRELVEHAKANYAVHKQIYDQINNRTTAGVSRRVDLDQAAGRLALAESNLLTEVSNLHDVSARYQRIVGELPSDQLPPLADSFSGVPLPENVVAALRTAYVNSPSFNAAIEKVRTHLSKRDVARSAYHPKLGLHASTGVNRNIDNNKDSLRGVRRESLVEVLFSFNVFRGGHDRARVRQAGEEVNQARDLREKACRDLRQTLTIAYQDTRSLVEKLGYLDLHQSSTAKAREAYRRQFDIGQRTLLDLLDSENEYFNARRSYTNARFDLLVAQARTLAGTGQLLHTLGVVREDLPTAQDAGQDRETVDPAEMCPADAPAPLEVNKGALLTTEASYR